MTFYDNEPDADPAAWPEYLRNIPGMPEAEAAFRDGGWPGFARWATEQAAGEVKTMTAHKMGTGELRAMLQPVIFLHLTGPAEMIAGPGETGFGEEVFDAGTLVAAQYWGNGQVMLTDPQGYHVMVKAHSVHAIRAVSVRNAPSE